MGLFSWTIKVDFEDKIIKIKNVASPEEAADLIRNEFEMRDSEPPIEFVFDNGKTTLNLTRGYVFDKKTISVMKEKDNRRYRNFRTSNKTSISSRFKRV